MMKFSAARWRGVGRVATSLAVGTLVLVLAACGGSDEPGARTYTIHGTLTMVLEDSGDCLLEGEYEDLRKGAKILVKDLRGAVLTTTTLSAGKPSPAVCEWTFAAHVPTAQFYLVTIPHRGEVGVSFSQMEKDHWSLKVTP